MAPLTASPRRGESGAALPARLLELLRCLECGEALRLGDFTQRPGYPELGPDGYLRCDGCGERYPVIAGTVRALPYERRSRLWLEYPESAVALRDARIPEPTASDMRRCDVTQRTADSFAYEWQRFGVLREEWRRNFIDYMQPHAPESFAGRLVLDVGTGSGRHAFHAAKLGAQVVAVDIGRSIDVARSNLPADVLTVQADARHPPFAPGVFDFVMSIGVLHHLSDPPSALQRIAALARPGGHVHIYLYWLPERVWQFRLLRWVGHARRITVRLPHPLLRPLCAALAALLAIAFVWPYRVLRRIGPLRRVADAFPLKTYADYPFAVLAADQFDRFSAPLERRYERADVIAMLEAAGLRDVCVLPSHGWIGDGRAQ
jgi:SAM-dependent methyltransferase